MSRIRTFVFLAALAALLSFASCSAPEYRRELVEADSLSSVDARRAMAMLDSLRPSMADAPEHERMYYRLLCIKAPYKAHIRQKSDSAILPLVEYYEEKGDKRLLTEAYYYAGKTYVDLNDAPRALGYYQKAMDVLPDDAPLQTRSKLSNQQGNLFLIQGFNNEAIRLFRKAYDYEAQRGDTTMMTYCMNSIAYAFSEEKSMDSSLYYYRKAYSLAKATNDDRVVLNIMGQIASFYTRNGDYQTAYKYITPALRNIDESTKRGFYSIASDVYLNLGRYDSAFYYCTELLKMGTVHAKQGASRRLTEIYLSRKDYDNASKYLKLFKMYADSVSRITTKETVTRMNALYNYNLREQENLRLKARNSQSLSIIIIIISALCITVFGFIGYVYRNRQRQKVQAEKLKRLREHLFEQSEEYIKSNEKKIRELEQELKEVSDKNKELVDRIEERRTDLMLANETAMRKQARNEATRARLASTDICAIMRDYIKKGKVMVDREWDLLDETINREVENFKSNLYGYYAISRHEYHVCLLLRAGIPPKDMAGLLGCTTSAVSKARKRLQEKFFSDSGTAKDFDNFINSL